MSSTTTSNNSDSLPIKLGEANYTAWSTKMKALLMSKKLWLYVSGGITKPSSDTNAWLENAYAASGLMLLNMEESQHTHVVDLEEDPAKMWTTLKDIHIQKKPNSRFLAYTHLLTISKQPEESLPSLTTRVEQALKDVKDSAPSKDFKL